MEPRQKAKGNDGEAEGSLTSHPAINGSINVRSWPGGHGRAVMAGRWLMKGLLSLPASCGFSL
jgi:hypothetical protein